MTGLVYLVQPSNYVGTNCYKIGMSKSNTIKRIKSYGMDCINVISRECSNAKDVESNLIKQFKLHFGKPFRGREWFAGSKDEMVALFDYCFGEYATNTTNSFIEINQHPMLDLDDIEVYVKKHIELTKCESSNTIQYMFYDLFNILGNEWFNQEYYIKMLIYALRNDLTLDPKDSIATMRHLLIERSDNNQERTLLNGFSKPMNYKQQRIGTCALTKVIKKEYPVQYEEWLRKWKNKEFTSIVYKQGSIAKLSDIKAIHTGMTAEKLLKLNSEFTISKRHICKSCLGLHKVKCCSKYQRTARSTCQFVNNISLM